jgi:cytosine deaminase
VARAGGTLGTFVLGQPERRDGIAQAFALADRCGLALDFHVDEGLDPGLDGLEIIAETAISTGFQGPVLCGHACALMNAEGDRLTRLLDRLAESGVHVAALPVTNLYLQGRQVGTPDRRGLTRIAELTAAGVPVVIGSDNVRDAFCPVGRHDPMAALALAILAGQLDPPLDRWLTTVTTAAATALGRPPVWIAGAAVADLRISAAADLTDLFTGHAGPLAPLTDTELETPCP